MYISKRISLCFIALLLSTASVPVFAEIVHKWVDAQGVTHYSDQQPEDLSSSVKQIAVSNIYSTSSRVHNQEEDYYSVTNQWARMRAERIERKQLQLEKKKQQAEQLVTPQVVYINQEEERPRSVYYPAYLGGHSYRNYKNFSRYTGAKHTSRYANRYSEASCRLPRNSYSRSGASLSLTFR